MKKYAIYLIRFISNLFRANNLRACRFYPSCSEYSVEAFQKFDFLKASWLTIKRVSSCHPFTPGGYQPVLDNSKKA